MLTQDRYRAILDLLEEKSYGHGVGINKVA